MLSPPASGDDGALGQGRPPDAGQPTQAKPGLGIGLGLRAPHFDHITTHWPEADWFEILSENFMHTGSPAMGYLDRIAERYPMGMHGVSLNIGSVDPLDADYLAALSALRARIDARVVSDHLCWTGVDDIQLHDLLPLPYTEEALAHIAARVDQVQNALGTRLVLENPSTYLEYGHSTIPEAEFMGELARRTGSGILLDINNVYVCAHNHEWPGGGEAYLRGVPWQHVDYLHLAGHSDKGTHLLDTHDGPVAPAVWELYRLACTLAPASAATTLVEWDGNIPTFETLAAEGQTAAATLHNGASPP